jgi:hypothetical protein
MSSLPSRQSFCRPRTPSELIKKPSAFDGAKAVPTGLCRQEKTTESFASEPGRIPRALSSMKECWRESQSGGASPGLDATATVPPVLKLNATTAQLRSTATQSPAAIEFDFSYIRRSNHSKAPRRRMVIGGVGEGF